MIFILFRTLFSALRSHRALILENLARLSFRTLRDYGDCKKSGVPNGNLFEPLLMLLKHLWLRSAEEPRRFADS